MRELAAAYQAIDRWLERNHNLTMPGYLVLEEALRRLEAGQQPMTMGEMCTALGYACSTATDAIDRLERKGWIERQRSKQDRRVIHLVLVNSRQTAELRRQLQHTMAPMDAETELYLQYVVDDMNADQRKVKAG